MIEERRLFIIRHAKSSWDHDGLDDIDRPLAQRGFKNAKDMAERLLKRKTVPDLLLTSPANRALNTALIMSKCWGTGPEQLQVHHRLYDARISDMDKVISGVSDEILNLAVFGHNPSVTYYANKFLDVHLDNLPTAGVVIVTLETESWAKIGRKSVRECYVDYPKRK
jgi:phosphohistidine phosphatase